MPRKYEVFAEMSLIATRPWNQPEMWRRHKAECNKVIGRLQTGEACSAIDSVCHQSPEQDWRDATSTMEQHKTLPTIATFGYVIYGTGRRRHILQHKTFRVCAVYRHRLSETVQTPWGTLCIVLHTESWRWHRYDVGRHFTYRHNGPSAYTGQLHSAESKASSPTHYGVNAIDQHDNARPHTARLTKKHTYLLTSFRFRYY